METQQIPGNFELVMLSPELEIVKYPLARMLLKCSIDCRIGIDGLRLAKPEHCYLLYSFQRWNSTLSVFETMITGTCSSRKDHKRSGLVSSIVYNVYSKGKYRIRYF